MLTIFIHAIVFDSLLISILFKIIQIFHLERRHKLKFREKKKQSMYSRLVNKTLLKLVTSRKRLIFSEKSSIRLQHIIFMCESESDRICIKQKIQMRTKSIGLNMWPSTGHFVIVNLGRIFKLRAYFEYSSVLRTTEWVVLIRFWPDTSNNICNSFCLSNIIPNTIDHVKLQRNLDVESKRNENLYKTPIWVTMDQSRIYFIQQALYLKGNN